MSTNNITYYVSVDSQYRDDSKYPLETDFGVKFKPSDIYATYPDQSFFYPEIAELYTNTGAYNPVNLAPNPSTITGSGEVYPKGEPLVSNQVYPRVTIDKNYENSLVTMEGGNIIQMKEVGDTIYVGAILSNPPYNVGNFKINVKGDLMFQGSFLSAQSVPVFATIKRTGTDTYTYGNCYILDAFQTSPFVGFDNKSYLIDMQINTTLGFCHVMFDFTAYKFRLRRVPAINDPNQFTDQYIPIVFEKQIAVPQTSWVEEPLVLSKWSNVAIVGFNSELSGLYIFNNTPWGYHQFYTYQNYEMMPSSSGYNQMLTDEAGNIYAAIHVSPTQYTRPLESPKGINEYQYPATPGGTIISNMFRLAGEGINNSKPLAGIYEVGGNVVMAGLNTGYGTPVLEVITLTNVNATPPRYSITYNNIYPPSYSGNPYYFSNDAAFFTANSDRYVAFNTNELSPSFTGLGYQVWQVEPSDPLLPVPVTGPSFFVASTLSPSFVVALDACDTDITVTPEFNGNPAIVCIVKDDPLSTGSTYFMFVHEFDPIASTLTQRASISVTGSFMVNIRQTSNNLQIYTVSQACELSVYMFDTAYAPDNLILKSSILVPVQSAEFQPSQALGKCSQVTSYARPKPFGGFYDLVLVAYDFQAYEFLVQGDFSITRNNPINNGSNFNYHFTQPSPGYVSTQEYLLSSNLLTGQSTVWNMTLPNKGDAYQVGDNFGGKGAGTVWFAINSYGLLHGVSGANFAGGKYYMSIAPFVFNVSPIAMLSRHQVDPQIAQVLIDSSIPGFLPPGSFPIYIAPFEAVDGDGLSFVQQVYIFSNLGRFIILDVTNFPLYNQTTYPWVGLNYWSLGYSSTFESYTNINVFACTNLYPAGALNVVQVVANNGSETRWTDSSLLTNYGVTGTLGFGCKHPVNGRGIVVNYNPITSTIDVYYADNFGMIAPTPYLTYTSTEIVTLAEAGYTLNNGVIVQFIDNVAMLFAVFTTPATAYERIWLIDLTKLNAVNIWGIFTGGDFQLKQVQATAAKNPLTSSTTVYVNNLSYFSNPSDTNLSSKVYSWVLPPAASIITPFPFFPIPFYNIPPLSQQLIQQAMPLGCSLDAATTLNNTNHFAVYQQAQNSPTYSVSYYDTTDSNNFQILQNFNVVTYDGLGAPNNSLQQQVVKLGGFTDSTILFVLNGAGQSGTTGTLSMYEVSNPANAQTASTSTSIYDGFGVGNAFVCKINSDGTPSWGTLLGDFKDVVLNSPTPNDEPTLYTSQFVNVTGIELDKERLNLYASVDWETKLMVRNYQTITGSQRLLRGVESSGGPSLSTKYSNSSVIKMTTSQGFSEYVIPIIGTNSVSSIDLSVNDKNVIVGESLRALTTVLYEKQLPSFNLATLKNPVVTQGVVSSPTPYTVGLISFDFDGTYLWSSNIEMNTTNGFNYGVSMAKTNDFVYLIGLSSNNVLNFKDKNGVIVQNWVNTVQYNVDLPTVFKYNQTFNYVAKYTINGDYVESDIIQSDGNCTVTPALIFVSEENNIVNVVNWVLTVSNNPQVLFRNKDGTLANLIMLDIQPAFDAFPAYSIGSRYKLSTSTFDTNGKDYSYIVAYRDVQDQFVYEPVDLFAPYLTGTGDIDFTNRHVYIPQLNQNYLIRQASFNEETNEFILLLNQKIDTSMINRQMPALIKYPIDQAVIFPDRYDTLFFYIANISTGETANFGTLSITSPNSILYYTTDVIDLSKQYYLIDSKGDGSVFIVPINGITAVNPYLYNVNVNTLPFLPSPSGRATPCAFLSEFNANALYTLQFFPAALNIVEYYTVSLQNLTIPNRDIRESTIAGVRNLSDFRYVWLEIYNADDDDVADTEFVNNTFSNNPNRNNKVIFQIPVTSADGSSNFSFYGSGQTPRIKFNPGFYNLRVRLLDPNGAVVLFDSTPTSANSGDEAFTNGVVDASLMNITVDLALTKYSSF